ncbi:HTH-type transcriptional regulator HmrR [Hydrogenovibrio crunogenus]|uniref:HTH-type transcriptional regulator HmrR n=1 Tax=Hydrogenovibrio crunogenus TaxID=39765 RepID=A0A4P7NXV2_9GAMM|nr:heavy metal-responsive transcriptional regulator [Hydrogenovibrio crunogenus]QBZ82315.1 HTH-type transcriptional regulator HmrR [Hydrogenovibrio crunogenus]
MIARQKNTQFYKIGEVSEITALSIDTLRYYEKIGLLNNINRTSSGVRLYSEQNLSCIRFIQRAKTMNFSLDEISSLLQMRENPGHAKNNVRELTKTKLIEVEAQLKTLNTLQKELTLLINLCSGSKDGCPIIEEITPK